MAKITLKREILYWLTSAIIHKTNEEDLLKKRGYKNLSSPKIELIRNIAHYEGEISAYTQVLRYLEDYSVRPRKKSKISGKKR
jgi:hypothetical protein